MKVRNFAVSSLVAVLGGCSIFRPHQQTVAITTMPSGLSVIVDGQNRGISPLTLSLDRAHSHAIMAATSRVVYRTQINPGLSVTGKLDMVGGALFLLPALGLLSPGAYALDDTVTLYLDEPAAAMTQPATQPVR